MHNYKVGDIWWRYENVSYAPPIDEFGDCYGESTIKLHLREYIIAKVTPKGVQLVQRIGDLTSSNTRFVLDNAYKKFACSTMALAKESYIARKKRQISIYKARVKSAEKALALIDKKFISDTRLT